MFGQGMQNIQAAADDILKRLENDKIFNYCKLYSTIFFFFFFFFFFVVVVVFSFFFFVLQLVLTVTKLQVSRRHFECVLGAYFSGAGQTRSTLLTDYFRYYDRCIQVTGNGSHNCFRIMNLRITIHFVIICERCILCKQAI